MKDKVIAIDGPSGSGKSTLAKIIAKKLNLTYLDTGAMFRAIAFKLHSLNIDFTKNELNDSEGREIESFLKSINFEYNVDENILIRIDGDDLTQKIREHDVSKMASMVSKFNVVRSYLAKKQKEIASSRPSILEGRDIGTVIFPNAALKIFLTASSDMRAKRRYQQLIEKDPVNEKKYDLAKIEQDIIDRDIQDTTREVAPLKKADDAIEVDTTSMSVDEVCTTIISEYKKKEKFFN